MNLHERLPSDIRTVDSSRINAILWYAGLGFVCTALILLLLHRLGLPMTYSLGITNIFLLICIVLMSWLSRTMTSSVFFFAGRQSVSASLGISGASDWISGTFLILFFSVSLVEKMIIAPALMVGLFFQAILFAIMFKRSGVSTLPGFFAWRAGSQFPGYAVLLVISIILAALTLAEFQVGLSVLIALTNLTETQAALALLFLAVLPSIIGGWLALLLVNAGLVIIAAICILGPAVILGFLPDFFNTALALEASTTTLADLNFTAISFLEDQFLSQQTLLFAVSLFVLAAGFATLPQAISRLSLSSRPIASVEALGWSALVVFLLLSALPLSIGLIGSEPSSQQLASLLKNHPVLHLMPYIAILILAYNGLTATLFSLSSAVVRALRRYRNLNPGEQSIFSTRLVVLLLAIAVFYLSDVYSADPPELLIAALVIGAGALFFPLVANIWIAGIPQWAITLAVLGGLMTTIYGLSPLNTFTVSNPVMWGAVGMAFGLTVLILGKCTSIIRSSAHTDLHINLLRNPENQEQ